MLAGGGQTLTVPSKGERLPGRRVFLGVGGGGLINLVVRWNTVYLQQVVQTLRTEGVEVRAEGLAWLSPARYEHIKQLGNYPFPRQVAVEPNGLRNLRKPSEAPPMGA